MRFFLELLIYILQVYIWVIFIRVILTWFRINPVGFWGRLYRFLIEITEPVLMVFKKIIPPIRAGRSFIDLSPLISIFVIQIIFELLELIA